MTCIYEACYPIIWPAIHYNVSVNLAIRIPTPCSGLSATTNPKIRGSVDILSRVNQHSWERSSGSLRSSNASGTTRIDSQTHVFASVQRGVLNNLSNMISIEGKLHPESPPTAPRIHSAITELDFARLYAIVWMTTFTPHIRLPLFKHRPDFFSRIYHSSFLLRYFPCPGSFRD